MGQGVGPGLGLSREEAAGRIMVALDFADAGAAGQLLKQLSGIPCYMKVGMELFYAAGPSLITQLKDAGYQVFLDVKMHDIPNTVKGGARSITRLGVDLFNVHAAGGKAMMEAALEGADQVSGSESGRTSGNRPLVIAVTQLTSTNQQVMNEEIGIAGNVTDRVIAYARLAREAGLDGVVSSAQETAVVKAACGAAFRTITPGIRPAGAALGDQARVVTPAEALRQGTDYMVIGRPVTAAADPRAALETIIEELMSV